MGCERGGGNWVVASAARLRRAGRAGLQHQDAPGLSRAARVCSHVPALGAAPNAGPACPSRPRGGGPARRLALLVAGGGPNFARSAPVHWLEWIELRVESG